MSITKTEKGYVESDDPFEQIGGITLGNLLRTAVFRKLNEMSEEYTGGRWILVKTSNDAFYIYPEGYEKLHLSVSTNFYEGDMSAEAAGIVSCLFVFNMACWEFPDNDKFHSLFYALRAFAAEHEEAGEIFGAID